jgi:ferredoxin
VLFHDGEAGRETLVSIASKLPEHVIPLQVEEVGAVGMDTWLATLAYGASHIMLLAPLGAAPAVVGALMAQVEYAAAILEGMGYSRERVQLIMAEGGDTVLKEIEALTEQPKAQPAGFAGVDEKRTTIRLAVDHLYKQAPTPNAVHTLPAGAPFGEIEVDRDGCTLCMACVSVCPSSALADGGDMPQLLFNEWNCVQCGLCEMACPEQVITRVPRFIYDSEMRRSTRTLNEEEPLCCIVCGKPFATRSMLNKVRGKLKGHWMFQKPELVRGMEMCEDCRVKDMLTRERGLTDVYKKS